jgi:hypothetical protein
MRWVLHGNLSAAVGEALVRHEQKWMPLAELSLAADASPRDILLAAQTKQYELLTTDSALVNAIFEQKIWFNRTILFLQLEGGDIEQDDAIDRLFQRYKRLSPGRLYTVTATRVKVRQLPHK